MFSQYVLVEPGLPVVQDAIRHALRTSARVEIVEWYARAPHYLACVADVGARRLVVKLAEPGDRPQRDFGSMAAIARLAPVPTVEVIAVNTAREPWYLITTHVPGDTWAALHPRLSEAARAEGQYQLGQAAAAIHGIGFDAFGQIDSDGTVHNSAPLLASLESRMRRRVHNPRSRELFLTVLQMYSGAFDDLQAPTLCHEDLNPYNLLFTLDADHPVLSGILDWESAWSSLGESDVARLELWRDTRGPAVLDGYQSVRRISPTYEQRRPVLQLLWALEYAEHLPVSALHQADVDTLCQTLGVPVLNFR